MCEDKEPILQEIRKRAEENGGVPMGWKKFKLTGMRLSLEDVHAFKKWRGM